MALGFSRLVCMYFQFLSIPSARYTDKADGPRREPVRPRSEARRLATRRRPHRPHQASKAVTNLDQREYSSTIIDSLISAPNSSRSGVFLKMPSSLVASTDTHAGRPIDSASFIASTMRSCFLDFSRTATTSPTLTRYDGMLTDSPLTVIDLCETIWRASARVEPKPMR